MEPYRPPAPASASSPTCWPVGRGPSLGPRPSRSLSFACATGTRAARPRPAPAAHLVQPRPRRRVRPEARGPVPAVARRGPPLRRHLRPPRGRFRRGRVRAVTRPRPSVRGADSCGGCCRASSRGADGARGAGQRPRGCLAGHIRRARSERPPSEPGTADPPDRERAAGLRQLRMESCPAPACRALPSPGRQRHDAAMIGRARGRGGWRGPLHGRRAGRAGRAAGRWCGSCGS